MKVNYDQFGTLELEAEDGRDHLWLAAFLEGFPKAMWPHLERHLSIDLESGCVRDRVDPDGHSIPAVEMSIEECIGDDGEVWGGVERIEIHPLGL